MKPARTRLAWTLLALAACGGGSDAPDARIGFRDAAVSDAQGMVDGAPLGPTRVTVRFQGTAKADALVAFHDADGMPVETATTGADGVAHGTAIEGGVITVGIQSGTAYLLTTYHGVATSDDILVDVNRPGSPPVDPKTTVTVNFEEVAGAMGYRSAVCANENLTFNAPEIAPGDMREVNAGCLDTEGNANVMVAAFDGTGVIAYGGAKGLTNGGATPTITLEAAEDQIYHASNVPYRVADADQVPVYIQAQWYVTGAPIGFGDAEDARPGNGDATGTIPIAPAGFYDFAINTFIVELGNDPRTVEVAIRTQGGLTPYPGPTAVDFSAALPAITAVSVDTSANPAIVVSWTARDPGLGATDGGRMRANTTDWQWEAIVPPTATSVTFPTLPAAMAAYNPPTNEPAINDVVFIESTSVPGYAELRQDWFRYFEQTPRGSETFRLTESTPGP